jgi:ligand-binding sensor domain-containing protein
LVHNSIKTISQDKNGYLWFGTLTGISKYDGYKFDNISGYDPYFSSEIMGIVHSKSGDIWITARNRGLIKISHTNEIKRFNSSNSIIPDKIKIVRLSKSQDVLVLSEDNRFFIVYSDSQIVPILNNVRLPDVNYTDMLEIDNGYALASEQGLYLIRYNRVQYKFTSAEGLKSNKVGRVIYDNNSDITFATDHGSIYKIINNSLTEIYSNQSQSSSYFTSLVSAYDGSIWMGNEFGVVRLEKDRKDYIGFQNGLPHNVVTSMFEDREGNIWIGTLNGVVKLNSLAYNNYPSLFPNTSSAVQKILKNEKDMWIFTNEGVSIFNLQNKSWRNYPAKFTAANRVNDAVSINSSQQLLATDDGVKEFQAGRISESPINRWLPSRTIKSLAKDFDGKVYVGTDSGLFVFKDNQIIDRYTIENEMPNNVINKIHVTMKNEILIGTESGFVKLYMDNIQILKSNNGLIGNFVTSITDDNNDRFWIGTKKGVSSLKNGRFTNYSPEFGSIETEAIEDVLLDKNETVWTATLKGLYLILPRNQFDVITSREGLLSDAVIDLEYDETNDIIFVGTNAGLTLIEQKYLKKKPFTHHITFTSFETNAKVYPLNEIVIPESENEISIGVSLFSFVDEKRIVFRYKLGDENWNYLTRANKITFKDLVPGDYRLIVQASLDGFNWIDQTAELNFIITSQIYRKWYFYLIALTLLAALFLLFYYLKDNKIEPAKRKIKTIAESTVHEIFPAVETREGSISLSEAQKKFEEKTEKYRQILSEKEAEISRLRYELKAAREKSLIRSNDGTEKSDQPERINVVVKDPRDAEEVKEYIAALDKTDWNIRKAARLLNLPHSTFHYRLKKLNLLKNKSGDINMS